LEHLTDFWETNLFFEKSYKGNPIDKHIEVDKKFDGAINELHFGTWINLWYQTIDELFEGDTAQIAKNRARNMGTYIHIHLFQARNKDTK
jgi:hemoglobin